MPAARVDAMGCGASTPAAPPAQPEPPPAKKVEPTPEPAKPAEPPPPEPVKVPPPEPVKPPPEPAKPAPKPPPGPAASSSHSAAAPDTKAEPKSMALPARIRTEELIKLCQSSHFDRTQVEKLYELFKVISASGDDDGLIDKSEFQKALGLKRNLFVDRMFELFDANGDQNINFQEFVAGLSVFTMRAKQAEKAKFSFKMYDFNGDQKIDKQELGRMLQATIDENKLNITAPQAQQLIDDTFDEAQPAIPGYITFDEYTAMVNKKPQLLEFMTIQSLNSMIS